MRSVGFLAAVVVVIGCGKKDSEDTSGVGPTDTTPPTGCYPLADGSCVEETFENPAILEPDSNGVYKLTLAPTEVTLDGQRHCVRAYNGAYPGPTIETPARVADTPRSVRVDLVNAFTDHDYRSLDGDDTCACTDPTGAECLPHGHGGCDQEGDPGCECLNSEGEVCEEVFDFNITNLHAHGSHTHPDYSPGADCNPLLTMDCRECGEDTCDDDATDDLCFFGDDVISQVHPVFGARYRWDLDDDGTHHEGLDWYHPHIHGTTAIQVASGAAGAWIVRGPLDEVPGIENAKERLLLFSTPPIADENGFAPLADGVECTEETLTFNNFGVLSSTSAAQVNLINGERRPRLVTAPHQVERWRFLHTGFLDEVFLGVFRGADSDCSSFSVEDADTLPLTQIARDGITLPQTYADDYVFMSPGYRIETLLGGPGQLENGETWCLVAARFLQEHVEGNPSDGPISPDVPPTLDAINALFAADGDVVAILNVTDSAGTPTETVLPDKAALAAVAPSTTLQGVSAADRCEAAAAVVDPTTIDQVAMLQVGFWTVDDPDPCECPNYNVNCKNIELTDRERYPFDRDLPLGAVEQWRVGASLDGHPFHIHINPFVACPSDNVFDPLPFAHWRDTYLVNVSRRVDLITEYRAFTGAFVLHCHKLTHEDDGMMQLLHICDPATDSTCGDNQWDVCDSDDLTCAKALAATECSVNNDTVIGTAACMNLLGGPLGVCGDDGCGTDVDCDIGTSCVDNVCLPDGPP